MLPFKANEEAACIVDLAEAEAVETRFISSLAWLARPSETQNSAFLGYIRGQVADNLVLTEFIKRSVLKTNA